MRPELLEELPEWPGSERPDELGEHGWFDEVGYQEHIIGQAEEHLELTGWYPDKFWDVMEGFGRINLNRPDKPDW